MEFASGLHARNVLYSLGNGIEGHPQIARVDCIGIHLRNRVVPLHLRPPAGR